MRKPFRFNFLIFIVFRLSSVFIISTSYVPDEYWQSLEIAHYMVFNYGYQTWEWKEGLRSYIYPFFFSILFKILEVLHLDFSYLLITVPKIFQALLTATSDICFIRLGRKFGFKDYFTKLVIFTNWFWYYCGFRTIANTFETSVTTIALYYYPWDLFLNKKEKKYSNEIKSLTRKYLILAAINCIVRPTAITFWGPLIFCQLLVTPFKHYKEIFLQSLLPAVIFTVPFSLLVDYFWYNRFIIPAYNFLLFNVIHKISSFYGTHPLHWYITQGLPVVLGLHYIPFLLGCASLLSKLKKSSEIYKNIYLIWLSIITLNLILLSIIPHKEFRFVLPLTPMMMLIVIKFCSDFFTPKRKFYKSVWTAFSLIGFLGPCVLFGILHQRGTLQLMELLRSSVDACKPNCFFLFLMPCHSTPLYSHLHANVSTKFLTCEPPLSSYYYDESEDFFDDPLRWLNHNWKNFKTPSHIMFFDSLENKIAFYLKKKGFKQKYSILHSVFEQERLGKYILVYES